MLTLDNVTKAFGARRILDRVNWSMPDGARVGLVGLNGAGKSTLLKMIAEVYPPDSGRIARPQKTRVGYLAQDAPEMGGRTVLAETLSALERMQALERRGHELEQVLAREHSGPGHDSALEEYGEVLHELEQHDFYSADSRATAVLFGLGFTEADLTRDVAEFSGGIRMRIALAKLLLDAPDFMMLDEPTNHLDIEARNWLEDFLAGYGGGIILVSHDRYFLDQVTNRTAEVSRGKIADYVGNYSRYLVQREERFALEMAAYENQRAEIEHMEQFISRFRYQASKARLVQSRIKQLEKVERLEPPVGAEPPAIVFPACERSARRVFELKAVKKYGELAVYDGIDPVIERGQEDRAGRTQRRRKIHDDEDPGGGRGAIGRRAYGRRESRAGLLRAESGRVAQLRKDRAPRAERFRRSADDAATARAARRDAVLRRRGGKTRRRALGGERARLALAKVLAQRNNCLLLDEPTNNLDIIAKDSLLEALRRFPGTVLLVSHDRFVLNELATEVIEVGQGHATRYLGNYDQYLEKKAQMEARESAAALRAGGEERETSRGESAGQQSFKERSRPERYPRGRAPARSRVETAPADRRRNRKDGNRTREARRRNEPARFLPRAQRRRRTNRALRKARPRSRKALRRPGEVREPAPQ